MRKVVIWFLILVLINSVTALELTDVDFNNDNIIDFEDIRSMLSDFGKTSDFDVRYDVNQDGKINLGDIVFVAKHIGQTYEPPIECPPPQPSSLEVTDITHDSAILNWNPGLGDAEKQLLRVGVDLQEINSGCPGNIGIPCVIKEDNLPIAQSSYEIESLLDPNKEYFWRAVNFYNVTCYSDNNLCFTTPVMPPQILPKPITGTFVMLDFTFTNVEGWRTFFQEMKETGMDTVILLATGYITRTNENDCTGDYVKKTYFDETWGLPKPPIEMFFEAAYLENVQIYTGLAASFNCLSPANQQDAQQIISYYKELASNLKIFYDSNGLDWDSHAKGFYINQELDIRKFSGSQAWPQYFQFYVDVSKELKALYPNKKILISPYKFEIDTYDTIYQNILYAIENTDIDIYAPQDSVGARLVNTYAKDASHFYALHNAVKEGNLQYNKNVEAWANIETFYCADSGCSGQISPATDINTLSWQIRATQDAVKKIVTWIHQWSFTTIPLLDNYAYYTPDLAAQRDILRADYLYKPIITAVFQWYDPPHLTVKGYNFGNIGNEVKVFLNYKTTDNQDKYFETTTTIYDVHQLYYEFRIPLSEMPDFDWNKQFELGVENPSGYRGYYVLYNPESSPEPSFP